MDKIAVDLYTDYLISSFGQVTATGLSTLLNGSLSHDRVSRSLNGEILTSADLWHSVKPLVRQVQSEDGVLIFDDSVEGKPYSDESEIICWHWDHCVGRSVKGLNLLSALYYSKEVSLPVAFELITKTEWVTDKKTGKPKRAAKQTKNELYRQMLKTCVKNGLPFRYVLNDVWFASAENMVYVKAELGKDFVMPLKDNRKITQEPPSIPNRTYEAVSTLQLEANSTLTIWLEGVSFPLLLAKQVFTNEDGSQGVIYLVTSDTTLTYEQVIKIYQKRWKVEEYHKSIKSNLCFARSPTRTVRTQSNHVFCTLLAFVKLERLRLQTHCDHFALKAKLYQAALASAFEELQRLKANCLPA
ncbi:MAG: transposase [Armatimonadota bacterium]|nr:transposase [Armatimonadota bacterium]